MSTATAGTADTGVDSVHQFSAKTSIAGNAVTVKAGKVGASAGYKDADFTQSWCFTSISCWFYFSVNLH